MLALLAAVSFLALALVGCSASARKPSSSITVAGSTSVQPFAEMLAEEYAKRYPDRPPVNVQGGGSSAGASAALSGAAQIGSMSRDLAETEKALTPIVIAHDAIAIVIHPSNAVSNLTSEQIKDIFSGRIADWSQVGGPPGQIHVVSREEGSGTRSAFDELLLKGVDVTPRAIVQDSNGAVRQTVSQDKKGVGYISLGLVDTSVKAVSIGGVEPSIENCKAGKYTVVRPFLFVVKGEMAPGVKALVDYVLGSEGQSILANEGLVVGN